MENETSVPNTRETVDDIKTELKRDEKESTDRDALTIEILALDQIPTSKQESRLLVI